MHFVGFYTNQGSASKVIFNKLTIKAIGVGRLENSRWVIRIFKKDSAAHTTVVKKRGKKEKERACMVAIT